jgi:hypothetical protein
MNPSTNETANISIRQDMVPSSEEISREEFVMSVPQQSYIWNLNVSQIQSWLTRLSPFFPSKPKPRIDVHGNIIDQKHLYIDSGK